jgi:hypothetical protein
MVIVRSCETGTESATAIATTMVEILAMIRRIRTR